MVYGFRCPDSEYFVLVFDDAGQEVHRRKVAHSAEGFAGFGGWLNARIADGLELFASLERPHGRMVEILLDHGVRVYPVNPKSLDRARDRYRPNGGHADWFDAFVLGNSLRVDHMHLPALRPDSEESSELKMLTRDRLRASQNQTRCLNLLTQTLKEYYRRPLEVFPDLKTHMALNFLRRFPTPESLNKLTRGQWLKFAREHRRSDSRAQEMWEQLHAPQLPVKAHIARVQSRQLLHLVDELGIIVASVKDYDQEVERFFVTLKTVDIARSLPACKTGTILPTLWAELGDAVGRWESFRHLQGYAGTTPFTKQSGKSKTVLFRYGCNKVLRYAIHWYAIHSLKKCVWSKAYHQRQLDRGRSYNQATRALASKWLKIIFVMWRDGVPYDENRHLASVAKQNINQVIAA